MTREEHIYQLKQYLQGKSISMCPSSSLYWQEHWEEVIKVLEQEPFINKPCVSSEVCEHDKNKVLDRIRAEIKHFMFNVNPSSSESDYACNYILDILYKFKSESEPQESEDL